MRQQYSRRTSASSDRFYQFLNENLPVRPSFAKVIAAISVIFVLFVMSCFAAVAAESSNSKLAESREKGQRCSDYYAAESTAVDILATLASDNGSSMTDKNGELKYNKAADEITVSRNGGNFSFDVPVDKKESLHVIAQINEGNIKIIQWYLTE